MPYTPYHADWEDYPSTDTPITAAALEYIEAGIVAASSGSGGGGSSGEQTTLDTSTAVGDTTLVTDAALSVIDGSFIAVGALTSKCEIRRVTAGAGTTSLTVNISFKLAHTAGVNVWVLSSPWVPFEWFGAKQLSTYDSWQSIQQAFVDCGENLGYGLTGAHNGFYYSTRPFHIYDNTHLRHFRCIASNATAGAYAIDCTLGLKGSDPDQFFVTLAGQIGTVTSVTAATNQILLSGSPGSTEDGIAFYPREGSTLPSPLEAGRGYYLKTNSGGNSWSVATDMGGTELDITDTGSGTFVWFSPGLARMRWEDVDFRGRYIRGLNGVKAQLQQPSFARSLRLLEFPGPLGALVIGGQQGDFYTTMVTASRVGIRCGGLDFGYFYGTNVEGCDDGIIIDNTSITSSLTATSGNHVWNGGHFEQIGNNSNSNQTICGNASVSAGTFTLTFDSQTTGAIAYNASAATIQTALEALSNIAPGDVTVTQEVGLLSAAGRMRIDFVGVYEWTRVAVVSIGTGSLTGGVYTMNRINSDAREISHIVGRNILFSGWRDSPPAKPDGTAPDFYTLDAASDITNGVTLMECSSISQVGNAVNDLVRGITIPWADGVDGNAAEQLDYFNTGSHHGSTKHQGWMLGGSFGGTVAWESYQQQLRVSAGASLRLGATGTPVKASTCGATSVADGGTITHGLGVSPDVVIVTPSVTGEFVSVTAKSSTTFTCAVKKHDNTAGTTQTVYWQALDV